MLSVTPYDGGSRDAIGNLPRPTCCENAAGRVGCADRNTERTKFDGFVSTREGSRNELVHRPDAGTLRSAGHRPRTLRCEARTFQEFERLVPQC
jgi:hypothetical protein